MIKILLISILFMSVLVITNDAHAAVCHGTLPLNSHRCTTVNNNSGNYHAVENCDNQQSCEYVCVNGYKPSSQGCVAACSDIPEHAYFCGDYAHILRPIYSRYRPGCEPATMCTYDCNEGYSSRACLPPICIDIPSAGALCSDDNQNLEGPTKSVVVKNCTDDKKCEYQCSDGFYASGGKCVPLICSNIPENADMCIGDDRDIENINQTQSGVVTECTDERKCEYTCREGYEKSGDECVAEAIVKCDDNLEPVLQAGDPACYISTTSSTTKNCTVSCNGPYYACDGGVQGTSPNAGSNCFSYLNSCTDSCGNYLGCSNNPDFSDGTILTYTKKTTVNTCYYLTVIKWGECDPNTGLQYAEETSVQQSESGTTCANKNEATVRTCGVCDDATNGKGTGTPPGPPSDLCFMGTPYKVLPTLNTQTNIWEWYCLGEPVKISKWGLTVPRTQELPREQDATCEAPRNESGECAPIISNENLQGAQGDYVYSDTAFRGELCTGGTLVINGTEYETNPPNNFEELLPVPDTSTDTDAQTTLTWGCNQIGDPTVTTSTTPDACSANRNGPQPGRCGPDDNEQFTTTSELEESCYNPDYVSQSIIDNSFLKDNSITYADRIWTWTCNGSKDASMDTASCAATCVPNIEIEVNPNPFLLTENGVTIEIVVTKTGDCASEYTCTIDSASGTEKGDIITFTQSEILNSKNVTLSCTNGDTTITEDISLNGYCVEKSCTANDTCQSIPKSGISSLKDCTSTCSSNADCSSGRLIETRP